MDAATRRCPLCALVGLLAFSLFGWYLLSTTSADPARLRAGAEESAAQSFAAAGFPWARLIIANDVGRIVGEAPAPEARAAAMALAQSTLPPMMGIPGLFARLSDEMSVRAIAAPRTPAILPRGDVAPTPVAIAPAAGVPPPPAIAGPSPEGGDRTDAPNAQVLAHGSTLAPWTGPAEPQWSHQVHFYPRTDRPAVTPTPTTAAGCADDIAALLASGQIRFAFASSTPSADSGTLIDRIASVIAGCPGVRLAIEGHTDSLGPDDKNLALSRARAESVRSALLARGVPATQLVAVGYGESRPLDPAQTDAARERNRRIEFRVLDAGRAGGSEQ